MSWTIIISAVGLVSTFSLSVVALVRTMRQDKRNRAAENLDEIFEGNQKLLENYAKDNENLRVRVTELEAQVYSMKYEHQLEMDKVVAERNDVSHKLLKAQKDNAKLIVQLQGS